MATTKISPLEKEQPRKNPLDLTVRETHGCRKVVPYKNPKAPLLHSAHPAQLFGVEFEIEGVSATVLETLIAWGGWKEDGSLRNNGRELITKPTTISVLAHEVAPVLERFTERNYSERCSIHVHVNCQDYTWATMARIAILYQTFEHVLFSFIGHDRKRNIFCVPWADTNINYNLIGKFAGSPGYVAAGWQKYTALNLAPLRNLGTIEFRHMEGHNNLQRLLQWLNIIGSITRYALDVANTDVLIERIAAVNTNSQYQSLMDEVFTDWAACLRVPDYEMQLEEGILNFKYSLIKPASGKLPSIDSILEELNFREEDVPEGQERVRVRVNPNRFFVNWTVQGEQPLQPDQDVQAVPPHLLGLRDTQVLEREFPDGYTQPISTNTQERRMYVTDRNYVQFNSEPVNHYDDRLRVGIGQKYVPLGWRPGMFVAFQGGVYYDLSSEGGSIMMRQEIERYISSSCRVEVRYSPMREQYYLEMS